jgi:hypothetical protein
MKNIHILLTSQPSRLYKTGNFLLLDSKAMPNNILETINQHIYITNDEPIKEGDWHLNIVTNKISKYNIGLLNPNRSNYKKIILTTDQDLINDGVQSIDDTFLEWFVKNPSCERVEVEPDYDEIRGDYYKIIIPQEEPKQETLEEAAEKQWGKLAIINDRAAVIAFKAGAKWQSERMYSEEDMHKAYCAGSDFDMSCLKDEQYYMFKKWFEQYKKK